MKIQDYDFMKQATQLFQPEQKKKEWYEELEEEVCSVCPSLTWQQRIVGCLVMTLVGFILSLGSTFRLMQLLKGNPTPFAVIYTLGNIVSISATCFLYGPWSQAKKMFAMTRIITTTVYFFFMGLCLFLAFFPHPIPGRILWILIAIICQFIALLWYSISFIPYARELITTCLRNTCRCDDMNCCRRNTPESTFWA